MSPSQPPPSAQPGSAAGPHGGARTLVIGVLGGIASGKSRVAELLAGEAGRVLSADRIAHAVLESEELRRLLVEAHGPGILDAEGRVDRPALGRVVFADPGARAQLEGWTHPAVRDRILAALGEARASGVPRVVLDVPLLLEHEAQHGLTAQCDALVFVDSDLAERERRATANRGWEPGEVARREATQLPPAEKRERADYVIPNRGNLFELERAARALSERLEAR